MNLKISKAFTTAPGPRYQTEGKFSGEVFRKSILLPIVLEALGKKEKLVINLDGTSGFGTSFLEESFGGLIRENNLSLPALQSVIELVSDEEPGLILEIEEYMQDAANEKEEEP